MSALEQDAPRGFVTMREYLKLQAKCDALEEKLALRCVDDRVSYNADQIAHLRLSLKIGAQGAKVLLHMFTTRHPLTSCDELRAAMDAPESKQVSVVTHRVNRRIEELGGPAFAIVGKPGLYGGFSLAPAARAWLKERAPEAFQTQRASR